MHITEDDSTREHVHTIGDTGVHTPMLELASPECDVLVDANVGSKLDTLTDDHPDRMWEMTGPREQDVDVAGAHGVVIERHE